ncbi:MAG: hypothetical protein ACOVO2_19770 [Emticicia sp.]|uniref:hypothetical protein n=1 Tax=Emticicia sp. TaxID=1930953 RepID=UPI003BA5A7D4
MEEEKREQLDVLMEAEEAPPFLKTWKNVYALVFISLVVSIVLFYAFTLYFA